MAVSVTLKMTTAAGPSSITSVLQNMEKNALSIPMDTARVVQTHSMGFSPVRTGYLKGSHVSYPTGQYSAAMKVNAFYGLYVNFGTRNMAAQPFFSMSIPFGQVYLAGRVSRMMKP